MKRAVVYVRVSTDKQAQEDRTSLALQEAECRRYAEREGWEVAGVKQDTVTAFDTLDSRPGLQEVRKIVEDKRADIVLCWMTSRIMRDQTDLAIFAREVYAAGGQIVSVKEGPFEDTPTGRLLLAITGWKDEQERITIKERLHGNLRAQVQAGRILPGAVPAYGYMWTGDTKTGYAINEETAPVIRRIFQMIDSGQSMRRVADALNDDGVPTPSQYLASIGMLGDKPVATMWKRQQITYLISNPIYCGRYAAYRAATVKSRNGKRRSAILAANDERRVELPGLVPALVTPEQFERVQQMMRGRMLGPVTKSTDEDKPLLLNGIGVCSVCGANVTTVKQNGKRLYVCVRRANRSYGRDKVCPGGSWAVTADSVDDAAWAQVAEMARDTEAFQAMLAAPMRDARDKLDAANRREGAIQAELDAAHKELETVSRRMTAEQDDDLAAVYEQRYKELKRQISGLETRQKETTRTEDKLQAYLDGIMAEIGAGQSEWKRVKITPPAGTTPSDLEYGMVDPTNPPEGWTVTDYPPERTRDQKRRLMRAIGARVVMYPRKSEYAQANNGKRWELVVNVPGEQDRFLYYPYKYM
jgi:DNA invertase Pin-like site-specific DNA recombinase